MDSQCSSFRMDELHSMWPLPKKNACKGMLCALKARNMFRWNTTQNRICVIKPGRNKSGGNSSDG